MPTSEETTVMLAALRNGDTDAAERLMPHVYAELRAIAQRHFRRQPADQTLQPTALVHEAYLKLVDQTQADWKDRTHFLAVASRAMRQILVDHARARHAAKRGGGWRRITLSAVGVDGSLESADESPIDLIRLDDAMHELAEIDQRQHDVVQLRFFGGLSVSHTAEALGVSDRTVELDWRMARAWLSRALSSQDSSDEAE